MSEEVSKMKSIRGGALSPLRGDMDMDKLLAGKVQPQSVELEQAVIGAILIDKDAMPSVIEILRSKSFYLPKHQKLYALMEDLFGKSQAIDILTVYDALKKSGELEEVGGLPYLVELSNKVSSSANIEFHARIVAQKFIQRELIRVSTQVIKDSFEDAMDVLEILDEAEKGLYSITDENLHTGYESLNSLVVKAQKEIEAISQKGGQITGVTTGFTDLDKITNGWQSSDLIIIAARPAMGKTAFTLSMAKNAAKAGKPVAIFSLEMANLQIAQRLLSNEGEINSTKLRNGQLDEQEWKRFLAARDTLAELPIYVDDTPAINIFELRAKCRRLKQNCDIQMIIIDYLQLMTGSPNDKRGNREQEISSISRALKGLAKELSVPVIALSQLSRAVETRGGEKRPQLSDLRESGAIEQDADIVTFLYRPAYYALEEGGQFDGPRDLAEVIISKHRNGALGTVNLKFTGEFVRFEDMIEDTFIGSFSKKSDTGGSDMFDPNPFGSSSIITRPSKLNSGDVSIDGLTDDFDPFDL
jgi:replicative DNA helicase